MAEITAKLVNELRAKTSQGMMECKKMLTEVGGDIEKAMDAFRKKGVKESILSRAASEGRVVAAVSSDGKSAALVEINTNTDFTAKSEPVLALANKAASLLLKNPGIDLGSESTLAADISEVARQTGENVRLGKTAVVSNPNGKVGHYLYAITGKIGVLVSVSSSTPDELIRDLAIHITAAKPLALSLNREGLPPEVVEKERQIAIEQAKATGKPQNSPRRLLKERCARSTRSVCCSISPS
jgi:elongation factor Ts